MWQRDNQFAAMRLLPVRPDFRVLVVEDNEASRHLARVMLSALGVRNVVAVDNGRAGLAALEKMPIDLVICDWMMPEMTGLDVLRAVRASHPRLPFVMLTALGDVEMVRAAKSAGVSAYLVKPISLNDLRAKVSAALQRPSPEPDAAAS